MSRRIMLGVADLEAQYCIPMYQNVTVGEKTDIKSLAKAMAEHQFGYRRYIFKTFPVETNWTVADHLMEPLWLKHAYG